MCDPKSKYIGSLLIWYSTHFTDQSEAPEVNPGFSCLHSYSVLSKVRQCLLLVGV